MRMREAHTQLLRLIVDFILLNLSILVVVWLKNNQPDISHLEAAIPLIYGNFLLLLTNFAFTPKVINLRDQFYIQALDIFKSVFLFVIFAVVITFLILPEWFPRESIIKCTLLFLILKLSVYALVHLYLLFTIDIAGSATRTVILGMDDTAIAIRKAMQNTMLGYDFIGYICGQCKNEPLILGSPDDLSYLIEKHRVEMVFAPLSVFNGTHRGAEYLQICNANGVRLWYVMEDQLWVKSNVNTESIGNLVLINPHKIPLDNIILRAQKRFFDIVFSSLVIVLLLSWLLPIIALLVKLSSRGPFFFVQKRTGINNKTFNCIKIRSMQPNPEADVKQAGPGDIRTTRIGYLLRKTNMDELPQFFNVFMGHMSVVGPRPHMLKHTEVYTKLINQYLTRHFIKPGITGWAQVNGYRGETNELWMMEKRVKYDTRYMRNWSMLWDIKIIWLTLFGKNSFNNAN